MFNKNSKWYLINVKNKTLGKISNFIINLLKDKNIFKKFLIINENLIKFCKKKYQKKNYYKFTKFLGGTKKKIFLEIYKNNKKEMIKNSILGMIKNNKIKKILKKNIKFLNDKKIIKNLKNKILYF